MNTPIKQEVYLPVRDETKIDDETEYIAAEYHNGAYVEGIERKEGYFFTTEELNQHISNVIKNALDTAAETQKETCICNQESCVCSDKSNYIMQSITNTFEQTFQKYKV